MKSTWLVGVVIAFLSSGLLASENPSRNLLRATRTKLDRHSTSMEARFFSTLTDGKDSSVADFIAPAEGIELIYRCSDGVVTAESLSIHVGSGSAPFDPGGEAEVVLFFR